MNKVDIISMKTVNSDKEFGYYFRICGKSHKRKESK